MGLTEIFCSPPAAGRKTTGGEMGTLKSKDHNKPLSKTILPNVNALQLLRRTFRLY